MMTTECWNCHEQIDSTDLIEINYKGYDMFVCPACVEDLKSEMQ